MLPEAYSGGSFWAGWGGPGSVKWFPDRGCWTPRGAELPPPKKKKLNGQIREYAPEKYCRLLNKMIQKPFHKP